MDATNEQERAAHLQALLDERYGSYADTARERATPPAHVLQLRRSRRQPADTREAA